MVKALVRILLLGFEKLSLTVLYPHSQQSYESCQVYSEKWKIKNLKHQTCWEIGFLNCKAFQSTSDNMPYQS